MQRLVDDDRRRARADWRCSRLIHRGSAYRHAARQLRRARLRRRRGDPRRAVHALRVAERGLAQSHVRARPGCAARARSADVSDVLVACPGVVYRRDSIDRLHTGTPHQLDVWRVARDRRLDTGDLKEMIEIVVRAALPGAEYRRRAPSHPYTTDGLQIDVAERRRVGRDRRVRPRRAGTCSTTRHVRRHRASPWVSVSTGY